MVIILKDSVHVIKYYRRIIIEFYITLRNYFCEICEFSHSLVVCNEMFYYTPD